MRAAPAADRDQSAGACRAPAFCRMAELWSPRGLQTLPRGLTMAPCTGAAQTSAGTKGEVAMDARTSRYHEVYARWQRDPEGFWGEAAQEIDWIEPAKQVFDPDAGVYGRWFVGGVCNTCCNAVDRHVDARPRRAGGDHLRFPARRAEAHAHL